MMDYEVFREVVKENFLDYMPEKYHGMKVRVDSVQKINRKLDGMSLHSEGAGSISPTIYISDMYKDYFMTGSLKETLQNAAEAMDHAFQRTELPPLDKSTAKDNIIFQLVNTMQNEDMLKNLPHREFKDLSIIYRWVSSVDERGIASVAVHDDLAKELGMDEEQLFNAALVNTRRILPPVVKPMNDVIREIFLADGMPPEIADIMFNEIPSERIMWIITNERGIDDAASMLYEDELHKLSVQLGTDLFVMPSSIHEVIAVPADDLNPGELAEMVSEINMAQVALEDRLSNQVYYYDRDLRELSLATDTPNKRLDGIVAEQQHACEMKQFKKVASM